MATGLDTLLIERYTGGTNMPTVAQAEGGYIARAAVDSAGRVNIEYVDPTTVVTGRMPGTFHVDDYGATPREYHNLVTITDAERTANVVAINACLEAARVVRDDSGNTPKFGGTVFMGPGVYYTNDAVGYDLAEDVNLGVTLQGLGPLPTQISSNNASAEVFKLYTTSGNIRMFYMKDIGLYGGRTGLSLVNANYNRFDKVAFFGSAQMALSNYLGFNNVFEACYFTDTSQLGGSAAIFIGCSDILSNCTFGENAGSIFVYNGGLIVNGGWGYDMYFRNTANYTDYWTTPGSPVNVSLAFWAGETGAFLLSDSSIMFTGFRFTAEKKFISLSGAQDLVMSGCQIYSGTTFTGFIDLKTSLGPTALSISGGQFVWNTGTSGYFIRENGAALLHDCMIQTQLVQQGTAVITAIGTTAPALLNPGVENNLYTVRTFVR